MIVKKVNLLADGSNNNTRKIVTTIQHPSKWSDISFVMIILKSKLALITISKKMTRTDVENV